MFHFRSIWLLLYNQIINYDSTLYCGNIKNISNLCGFYCTGNKNIRVKGRMGVIAKYVIFLTWVGTRWGVLDHPYIRKKRRIA